MITIDRRGLCVMYSLKRWLDEVQYTVGATSGGFLVHFPGLAIRPAYPDDLTQIVTPTLALSGPGNVSQGDDLFGGQITEDRYGFSIHGFVLGQGSNAAHMRYRDRLMNDVYQMLIAGGDDGGMFLYDVDTEAAIGDMEVQGVQALLLQSTAPEIDVERFRFLIMGEVPLVA